MQKMCNEVKINIAEINLRARKQILKAFSERIKIINNDIVTHLLKDLENIVKFFTEKYPHVPEISKKYMVIDSSKIEKELNLEEGEYFYKFLLLDYPRMEYYRKSKLEFIYKSNPKKFSERLGRTGLASFIANGTTDKLITNLSDIKEFSDINNIPNIQKFEHITEYREKILTEITQDFNMFKEQMLKFITEIFERNFENYKEKFLKSYSDNEPVFKEKTVSN
jgi:hypothetical protein